MHKTGVKVSFTNGLPSRMAIRKGYLVESYQHKHTPNHGHAQSTTCVHALFSYLFICLLLLYTSKHNPLVMHSSTHPPTHHKHTHTIWQTPPLSPFRPSPSLSLPPCLLPSLTLFSPAPGLHARQFWISPWGSSIEIVALIRP
jgi:hypothetical protein